MNNLNKTISLANGVKIPNIGFGTYLIENEDEVVVALEKALEVGYRHIDTAKFYKNEALIGKVIKKNQIPREEIFITSKVWPTDFGYEKTKLAFEKSIKELDTDYLDLYLLHWPKVSKPSLNVESWKALEDLYTEGKIRAIGVSNYEIHHLTDLMKEIDIIPMINQVELHPQYPQDELREFCSSNNIVVEAWAPLMQGKIFKMELMQDLADKYNKTIAQITLRWHYQSGIIPLPKSTKPERIKANYEIFDFEISNEDMKKIESLKGKRMGTDPNTNTF